MEKTQQARDIVDKISGASELEWSELAANSGMGIHPDSLRKMGAGVRLLLDAGMICDGNSYKSHNEQTYIESQKLRDQRREYHELLRSKARSEALLHCISDSAQKLTPIHVRPYEPIYNVKNRTLVVCIADCHYGAEWRITGLHDEVVNEYSPEIFNNRMSMLLGHIQVVQKHEEIDNVVLLLAGDSLDGILRQSQLTRLRWGMIESCMRFAEYMAQWIAYLAEFARVRVYSVDGNHTEVRPLGSKRGEFSNENLEKIIMWFIHERLKDVEHVSIDHPTKNMKMMDIQGFSFLLTHDTLTKNMEAAARQAMLLYGERIDYVICGHKHREQEVISGYTDTGSTMIVRVPSLCGTDQYAQSLGFGGAPGALLMLMEKEYGRRCVYPITLQ